MVANKMAKTRPKLRSEPISMAWRLLGGRSLTRKLHVRWKLCPNPPGSAGVPCARPTSAGADRPSAISELFRRAIQRKRSSGPTGDSPRDLPLHALGHGKGREEALVFQFAGESSHGLRP